MQSCEARLSIDAVCNLGSFVHEEVLMETVSGCWKFLASLNKLAWSVQVIRVTFAHRDGDAVAGPTIRVIFADPLKKESFYETDYRFMCGEFRQVKAEQVCRHLMEVVPDLIREHLRKCEKRMAGVSKQVREQLS